MMIFPAVCLLPIFLSVDRIPSLNVCLGHMELDFLGTTYIALFIEIRYNLQSYDFRKVKITIRFPLVQNSSLQYFGSFDTNLFEYFGSLLLEAGVQPM